MIAASKQARPVGNSFCLVRPSRVLRALGALRTPSSPRGMEVSYVRPGRMEVSYVRYARSTGSLVATRPPAGRQPRRPASSSCAWSRASRPPPTRVRRGAMTSSGRRMPSASAKGSLPMTTDGLPTRVPCTPVYYHKNPPKFPPRGIIRHKLRKKQTLSNALRSCAAVRARLRLHGAEAVAARS